MTTPQDPAEPTLLMPFVVVASRGGPYDAGAYTAGYEMGCLVAALAAGPARHEVLIHAANATQADLIAMRRGHRCVFDSTEFPDWTHTTFTPQREE